MTNPTVTETLLEVLERPFYDGMPFTITELLAIIRAEGTFPKLPSVACVRLRLNHLAHVGRVRHIDADHVIATNSRTVRRS